jgi:hypothetical protein
MAKVIKYGDTSGIEGNLPQAPVGLYFAKVDEITQKPSKNGEEMVEIIWAITKDANGKKVKKPFARIWSYAPLDPKSSWARRLKELIEAFGLKDKNGNLASIEGKEAMVRLREDTDNDGEYRPQISKVLKPKVADDEEPDEDEDEDEADEDEDGDDAATTALAGLSRTELKALIKDEELEVKVLKSMSDDDLRAAIVDAGWEPEGDEEEPDDEDEEDDEEDDDDEEEAEEDNYDDMSIKELRQEAKDRELDTKGSKAVLIARLRTDDEEEPV